MRAGYCRREPPCRTTPTSRSPPRFDELGDLYELDGAIIHRVLAYRTAAKAVRDAPMSVGALAREGRVTELPGIGRTLEEKILALLDTGTIPAAEKLRAKFPPGLMDVTRLPGLGPKRARRLFDQLGIDSLDALREAAEGQRLRGIRGFGPKFEQQRDRGARRGPRRAAGAARPAAAGARARRADPRRLRAHPAADRVELAGCARRLADSVKDLDIIATATDPAALAAALGELDVIESARWPGRTPAGRAPTTACRSTCASSSPSSSATCCSTSPARRRTTSRCARRAVRRGLHVCEYGILDDATGETLRCATEEEVYERLGLACDRAGAARGPRRARGRG